MKVQEHSPDVMITDKLRSYGRSKERHHAGTSSIARTKALTTERRIPINRPGDEKRIMKAFQVSPTCPAFRLKFMTLSPPFFTFHATRTHQTTTVELRTEAMQMLDENRTPAGRISGKPRVSFLTGVR